ncbi:VOC family protein [Roseococcus thiosulfatophilus]|uniref:VOC family protein n=1 Tax=Roseococcus thiosulfatophilus TaxID=35813 RepID=UPI001A8DC82E|nr:VOC family protein [Roseococcus thiosulfatophilus]
MFSHVTFGTNDLTRAAAFYDPLMARLGFRRIESDPAHGLIGYGTGPEETPQFYLMKPFDGQAATVGNGAMAAFEARDRATVDEFHRIAMEGGGSCEGPPGLRPHYHPDYYGTYVRDADGNKLCCVCHRPA